MIKPNLNRRDIIIRFTIGGAIIISGIIFRNALGLLGLMPVIFALIGWSPLYGLLRINKLVTKKRQSDE